MKQYLVTATLRGYVRYCAYHRAASEHDAIEAAKLFMVNSYDAIRAELP